MANEPLIAFHSVQELFALGRAHLEAGRPTESCEYLSRAAALAPGDPQIRYFLALAYSDTGRPAQ